MDNTDRFTIVDSDNTSLDTCMTFDMACDLAGDYAYDEQETVFIVDNEAGHGEVERFQVDPGALPRPVKLQARRA